MSWRMWSAIASLLTLVRHSLKAKIFLQWFCYFAWHILYADSELLIVTCISRFIDHDGEKNEQYRLWPERYHIVCCHICQWPHSVWSFQYCDDDEQLEDAQLKLCHHFVPWTEAEPWSCLGEHVVSLPHVSMQSSWCLWKATPCMSVIRDDGFCNTLCLLRVLRGILSSNSWKLLVNRHQLLSIMALKHYASLTASRCL